MLRVILAGWSEDGNERELSRTIQNATGIGKAASASHVTRLRNGDTVILTVDPERLRNFLHLCLNCGVTTADMLVGRVEE